MLHGQHSGFTKFPCFLCLKDSRDRSNHQNKKCWPQKNLTVAEKNVVHEPLVPPRKVLLRPHYIKQGLMKHFIKLMPRNGNCFKYLVSKFSGLSEAKLTEGVFVGEQCRFPLNRSQKKFQAITNILTLSPKDFKLEVAQGV